MSEIVTVFFGSIILASMAILIHLFSAYHPYHNPAPLALSSLATMSLSVLALATINVYLSIAIILFNVSFKHRKDEPL